MWRASKPHQLQLSPGCQVAYVSGAPGTSLGAWQSCCARTQRQACKAWLLMVWLDAGEFHRETWWKMAEVGRMDLNPRSDLLFVASNLMQPGCPYPFASFCHGCLTHPPHFIQSCFHLHHPSFEGAVEDTIAKPKQGHTAFFFSHLNLGQSGHQMVVLQDDILNNMNTR